MQDLHDLPHAVFCVRGKHFGSLIAQPRKADAVGNDLNEAGHDAAHRAAQPFRTGTCKQAVPMQCRQERGSIGGLVRWLTARCSVTLWVQRSSILWFTQQSYCWAPLVASSTRFTDKFTSGIDAITARGANAEGRSRPLTCAISDACHAAHVRGGLQIRRCHRCRPRCPDRRRHSAGTNISVPWM